MISTKLIVEINQRNQVTSKYSWYITIFIELTDRLKFVFLRNKKRESQIISEDIVSQVNSRWLVNPEVEYVGQEYRFFRERHWYISESLDLL